MIEIERMDWDRSKGGAFDVQARQLTGGDVR